MKKFNVAILLGGKSGEHEVSIVSARNVAKALDRNKYEVFLIGIDKTGRWVLVDSERLLESVNPRDFRLDLETQTICWVPFSAEVMGCSWVSVSDWSNTKKIKIDVAIPILHGTYGEDGTVQGLLELAEIPYVGSGVIGSAVGMDKDVGRRLMREAGIPVVPTKVIRRFEYEKNPQRVAEQWASELGLPFFIKPANSGSSVGVHKIKSIADLAPAIKDSFDFDDKVLAEKSVMARELEVAVLGNFSPMASIVGEIIPTHEFYSYEAKYIDDKGADLNIPAKNLSEELSHKIRQMAIHTFQVLELRGMARVDFFLDKLTGELFLNEVNTIPGFTNISMYPKLWEASGISYVQLLDELIKLAIENHQIKKSLKTSYHTK